MLVGLTLSLVFSHALIRAQVVQPLHAYNTSKYVNVFSRVVAVPVVAALGFNLLGGCCRACARTRASLLTRCRASASRLALLTATTLPGLHQTDSGRHGLEGSFDEFDERTRYAFSTGPALG